MHNMSNFHIHYVQHACLLFHQSFYQYLNANDKEVIVGESFGPVTPHAGYEGIHACMPRLALFEKYDLLEIQMALCVHYYNLLAIGC